MAFTDCHIHLAQCEAAESILGFARASATVLYIVSTGLTDSKKSIDLRSIAPTLLKAFVGVHPSEAEEETKMSRLEPLCAAADGVGEVGLDPKYSPTQEGGSQMRWFTEQVELAEKLGKPLQVHSRGAEILCLERLKSFHVPNVLLHWFEGEELVNAAQGAGYYVSFGPALFHSKKLARIASRYATDLILTESDAPVTYAHLGTEVSGPHLVPSVVFFLAGLLRISFEELQDLLQKNARRYIGEDGKG